jgi:hypothetical protein
MNPVRKSHPSFLSFDEGLAPPAPVNGQQPDKALQLKVLTKVSLINLYPLESPYVILFLSVSISGSVYICRDLDPDPCVNKQKIERTLILTVL